MPTSLKLAALAAVASLGLAASANASLIITGIIDGPRTGGLPKAIEIYVAADVADASIYSIVGYNNGTTTPPVAGIPLTGALTEGDFLYVSYDTDGFTSYFGFAPDYVGNALNVNGDDVVTIQQGFIPGTPGSTGVPAVPGTAGTIIDTFGTIGERPTADTSFNYLDSFAYRVDGTFNSATFNLANYTFPQGQSDALDPIGSTGVNPADGDLRFPVGTFQIPEPASLGLLGLGGLALLRRRPA